MNGTWMKIKSFDKKFLEEILRRRLVVAGKLGEQAAIEEVCVKKMN